MSYKFNPLTGNFDIVNPKLTGSEIKTLYEDEDNTNAFTDAEKSKLAALDSDGYVQLTGDQTIAGIKTFTSPLILPNNSRVNGVEHFYQSGIPATRGDGSVLVVGDILYNPTNGKKYFWNGTYWLGDTLQEKTVTARGGSATPGNKWASDEFPLTGNGVQRLFIEYYTYTFTINGTVNANNYFTIQPRFRLTSTAEAPFGSVIPMLSSLNTGLITLNLLVNKTHFLAEAPNATVGIFIGQVGLPTIPQNLHATFYFRDVLL